MKFADLPEEKQRSFAQEAQRFAEVNGHKDGFISIFVRHREIGLPTTFRPEEHMKAQVRFELATDERDAVTLRNPEIIP